MLPDAVFIFGDCRLDAAQRQLFRNDQLVALGPQVLNLLIELVRQRHRVLTRQEVCAAMGRPASMSDSALHACISRTREAIGDRDRAQPMIKTLPRFGYRFAAEVAVDHHVPLAARTAVPVVADERPRASEGFFGRTVELETLARLLQQARAGQMQTGLLTGHAGIGKTRLARELEQLAAASGVEVLTGRCDDGEHPPSLWPWAQVVRSYVTRHPADAVAAVMGSAAIDVARIAPALRDCLPQLEAAISSDPELARMRTIEGLLLFLNRVAAERPLLLVLDDLHWIDAASLSVLQALATEQRGRILLLGIYGTEHQARPPIVAAKERLVGERLCTSLEIGGIAADSVGELVGYLIGAPPPASFVSDLYSLTDGNPLYVGETVAALEEAGLLSAAEGRWPAYGEMETVGPSPIVQATARRRLRQLSPLCMRVLGIASIADGNFCFADIERVAALPGDEALMALEEAVQVGVVSPIDGDGALYRFAQPLLRETVRQGVNPTRRARLRAQLLGT